MTLDKHRLPGSVDKHLPNGRFTSTNTEELNNITQIPDATPTKVQNALDNAQEGDVIEFYGDITIGSGETLTITTDKLRVAHRKGTATLNDDFIQVGGQSTTVRNTILELSQIDGQDYTQNRTAVTLENANQGRIDFTRRVDQCKRLLYAHGTSNGKANDWDVFLPNVSKQFETALELFGENADVEGINFYGGAIFDATKTVHVHGTSTNVGTSTLYGTTLHGSTSSRNTDEILEEDSAADNTYIPRFVADPDNLVSLNDGSNMIYRNRTQLGRPGVRRDSIPGESDAVMDYIDSSGTRVPLLEPAGTDGLRLNADSSAAGAEAGILQLDGDTRIDLLEGGSTIVRIDGSQIDLRNNQLKDVSNNTTGDSMTADPESGTEDGFIEIDIGGTIYQVPIYQA